MSKKIYVGNLSRSVGRTDLESIFSTYGAVQSVGVVLDRNTGRPKGLGYVEMRNDQEALTAIASLHNRCFRGLHMTVYEGDYLAESPPQGALFSLET
jgi:cold-inducible RNA-binding protein